MALQTSATFARNSKGISALEVTYFLLIASLVAAAAVAAFTSNRERIGLQQAIKTVAMQIEQSKAQFSADSYVNMTTARAIDRGVLEAQSGTLNVGNPYKGFVQVCGKFQPNVTSNPTLDSKRCNGVYPAQTPSGTVNPKSNVGLLTWSRVSFKDCASLVLQTMRLATEIHVYHTDDSHQPWDSSSASGSVKVSQAGRLLADCPSDSRFGNGLAVAWFFDL